MDGTNTYTVLRKTKHDYFLRFEYYSDICQYSRLESKVLNHFINMYHQKPNSKIFIVMVTK